MDTYNFWQDFFATFRSSPDVIKALWLIIPPVFAAVIARIALKSPNCPFQKKTTPDISSQTASSETIQSGKNEEILIFVGGRLLDRFDSDSRPVYGERCPAGQ